jgi:hypothetical protein
LGAKSLLGEIALALTRGRFIKGDMSTRPTIRLPASDGGGS